MRLRNIWFGIIASIIMIVIFGLVGWLNFISAIIILVFWLGPALFSSKFE